MVYVTIDEVFPGVCCDNFCISVLFTAWYIAITVTCIIHDLDAVR